MYVFLFVWFLMSLSYGGWGWFAIKERVAFPAHFHLLFYFYILMRILFKKYIYQNQYVMVSWLPEGDLFSWSGFSNFWSGFQNFQIYLMHLGQLTRFWY